MTLVWYFKLTNQIESKAHLFGFHILLMGNQSQKSHLNTLERLVAIAIPTHHLG